MSRSLPRHAPGVAGESTDSLRQTIAIRAARLVAEEGMEYALAKRKAARDILGNQRVPGGVLPDNDEIEEEVRAYQALFQADTQPLHLLHLRRQALQLMERLSEFNPYLCGAVLNGTATQHSDIHLQLFCDSAKDVEIFLLNEGVEFEVGEVPDALSGRRRTVETLHFMIRGATRDGVQLTIYGTDDLRGALSGERRGDRADHHAVRVLIEESNL